MKINDKERKVLEFLAPHWEEGCYYFAGIAKGTELTIPEVRRACRSLAKKGYTEFTRGLMDDDGMVAGSGYCATKSGANFIGSKDEPKQ